MADLTTVAAVKAYLSITTTGQDALIASFIARNSTSIEKWTETSFPGITMTRHRLNGTGSAVLVLPESPVLDVSLLEIDGVEIPLSVNGRDYGYSFDDVALYLVAARFPMGRRNVVCSWTAGWQTTETGFIPAGNAPSLTPTTGGRAVTNLSVTKVATAVVMTQVGSSPAAGQYTFSAGTYSFATADANLSVTMAYQFVPGPIEQACIDMVSQDLKGRDNIGVKSKTLAGESVHYSSDGLSVGVKQTLQRYRKRTPC